MVINWAASTGDNDSVTVQNVMYGAVAKWFGNKCPILYLTDNGSAYRVYDTRRFAKVLNSEACIKAVSSSLSNGMSQSFVKTMKENYIVYMAKPDVRTALKNLAVAFNHYNGKHPYSALGYCLPRKYLRRLASNEVSDKKCMGI